MVNENNVLLLQTCDDLPEPSLADPFAQVRWVFHKCAEHKTNAKTRESYYSTGRLYHRFLAEFALQDTRLQADPRFYLHLYWDSLTVYRFADFLEQQGYASNSVHCFVNCLTKVFRFAANLQLTASKKAVTPDLPPSRRETSTRDAYEDAELEAIKRVLAPRLQYAQRIANGYKKTGIGQDPRIGRNAFNAFERKDLGKVVGWKPWANMVWYFEHVLDCKPFLQRADLRDKHASFGVAASTYHGGIQAVWEKLGVTSSVTCDLITSLAFKLALETGLNPTSLLELKRDCLREAPVSGAPTLYYYKARSRGHKELPLHLLDQSEGILSLRYRQSVVVKNTIQVILTLTAPLVSQASDEIKDFLFLYEPLHNPSHPEPGVIQLQRCNIKDWRIQLMSELTQEERANFPEFLNLARFRRSKLTNMVREGFDLGQIQTVAGHLSALFTLKYIEETQIAEQAATETSAAFEKIHQNKLEQERAPLPYAESTEPQPDRIFRGILGDCKNPFDPPAKFKQLPNYVAGQACQNINKCFTCPHLIITTKHLPLLIQHKADLERGLLSQSLDNTPLGAQYQRDLEVIQQILQACAPEDLARAEQEAEQLTPNLDAVFFKGVVDE